MYPAPRPSGVSARHHGATRPAVIDYGCSDPSPAEKRRDARETHQDMTYTDPPPGGRDGLEGRRPPLSRLVGRRPDQGAVTAAKTVVDDLQALLRAEIALAKAEVADGVKAKAMGAGLFIAVAIIGWLALQTLLVFLGFLFDLFLPAWAAVGLVLLLLLIAMGVLGYMGYRKVTSGSLSLATTKATAEESKQATQDAVEQVKADTREGVEEAKVTVAESVDDVKARVAQAAHDVRQRLDGRRGAAAGTSPSTPPTTPEAPRA